MNLPASRDHPGPGPAGEPSARTDQWALTDPRAEWASLSAGAKHERLLSAAGQVFTTQGLDASMPTVAATAGAGVGSLYRHYPSKRDLLAALVVRRLDQITSLTLAATTQPGERWSALTGMLRAVVEQQWADDFLGQAWHQVSDHGDVAVATDRATAAFDRLLVQAREEGRLRQDATSLDIRLLFTATRAAKQVEPQAWERMLTLLIDGLDTRRG
jgi:AcrR family transcriptional regulator